MSNKKPVPDFSLVFVDIDTQKDFIKPDGALSVPGAEKIRDNLKTLVDYALENDIKIIASMDAHLKDDPEFEDFPPHCVKGEPGQAKIEETQVEKNYVVEKEQIDQDIEKILSENDEVILEKQTFDVFSNLNADELFNTADVNEYVVFGVATDYCVKAAVLSLLERGNNVTVIEDAIAAVDEEDGAAAIDKMKKNGARFKKTEEIMGKGVKG